MKRRAIPGPTFVTEEVLVELTGVSLRQLRRYEAEGLVAAEGGLRGGRRAERFYARRTVHLVRRIRSYEVIGVNLAGIDIILRLLRQLRDADD